MVFGQIVVAYIRSVNLPQKVDFNMDLLKEEAGRVNAAAFVRQDDLWERLRKDFLRKYGK